MHAQTGHDRDKDGTDKTGSKEKVDSSDIRATRKLRGKSYVEKKKTFFFSFFRKILAGGRCPPDPPVFGWGGKAPPDPPLNGRSSHLIEAAKRGRLDQMIFFSAPLTTRTPPGRPAGRPAERPAWYGSHQFEQTYV